MFRFESPIYFLLVIVLGVIAYYRHRKHQIPVLGVSHVPIIQGLKGSWVVNTQRIIRSLKYLALILMIVAMARPQWGTKQVSVLTEGINIILAIDVSGSMAALDFKQKGKIVNRLEAVKGVVHEFIMKREGDRIGLVVFGTAAFTQVPLTRDYDTIAYILDRVEIGAAGENTAIGDAIGISLKRLQDIKSQSNIIILLTDGQSNAGEISPEAATDIAVEKKIKIYTVGVGSKGEVPFLVKHPVFGERYVYQRVDFDEDTLKHIASTTGGLYYKAEHTEQLADIYNAIDKLEKTKIEVKTFAEYNELYLYLLIPAFIVLVIYSIAINTRYLEIP
ncbi:MAG: VWA domain-containing protein [Desulfobacterales bacterium]|nr:VWA domain-containing protein [Desulfobacterales bacterium]